MRKIYYQDSGYPIERNLVNLPLEHYRPEKKIVFIKVLNHLYYKFKGNSSLLSNLHWELFRRSDGLWHFFNGISLGKTPWVTTFETSLPRWNINYEPLIKYGIKALAGKSCQKVIALSQCAKKIQTRYLQEKFPYYFDEISQKITVIHPPQRAIIQDYNQKELSDKKIVFTIVGHLFFIKGGKEILTVFDHLLQENYPIELNIISSLKRGGYAARATTEDLYEAKRIIKKYPDNINHYENLANVEVLEKFKHSHIGLLPSYAETYGYSALEAQACACPVITTNIRALPEINNKKCGWLIEVPKNERGDGKLKTDKQRMQYSNLLKDQLYSIIIDIIKNPHQIAKKGRLSLEKIMTEHDPHSVANRLEKIYRNAMK